MTAAQTIDAFATARLTAEKLSEGHLEALVTLHLDPGVSRYIGGVRTRDATKAYLAANLDHWKQHGYGLWVLRSRSGDFAGRAGVRQLMIEGGAEVEVTYAFQPTFWGQGLASEVTEALADLGLNQLGLASLVGIVVSEHGASRRVLEKSGFAFERDVVSHGEGCAMYRRRRSA
jgi:RimJ/RimL family protein N-acetyltransferase